MVISMNAPSFRNKTPLLCVVQGLAVDSAVALFGTIFVAECLLHCFIVAISHSESIQIFSKNVTYQMPAQPQRAPVQPK